MAIQTINLGNYANDGTGDDLRTAFQKVNANFTELGASDVRNGLNLGEGAAVFSRRNTNAELEFKTLTSTDNSIVFTINEETLNLEAKTILEKDTAPTLGAPLNLNNHYVYGGDVQTTVFGLDVRQSSGLVELMIASGTVSIDFGSFLIPTGSTGAPGDSGYTLDMNGLLLNGFVGTPQTPNVDFGIF